MNMKATLTDQLIRPVAADVRRRIPTRHRPGHLGGYVWTALLTLCTLLAGAAEPDSSLATWLKSQADIQTWSADFTQTRMLKTFTQPLTSTGHVWFASPSRFRWELGNPPSTIAIHTAEEMLVIYPRLHRAERYPLTGAQQAGSWKDMLALLEAGFPRSQAEVESRFRIISTTVSNNVGLLTLQPKSAAARRMMPEVRIGFGTNDLTLRSTEMEFADGSRMRNDFSNQVLNPKLEDSLFSPKLGSEYKIIEPLAEQKGKR